MKLLNGTKYLKYLITLSLYFDLHAISDKMKYINILRTQVQQTQLLNVRKQNSTSNMYRMIDIFAKKRNILIFRRYDDFYIYKIKRCHQRRPVSLRARTMTFDPA